MLIVERIKTKCEQKGTKMGTLEKELGFGNGTIRRWDERMPSADKVLLIAKRLDVTVEWILTGKEAADLTPEEQQLVNYYRQADDRGKRRIMQNAEAESAELRSSTSMTGLTGTDKS